MCKYAVTAPCCQLCPVGILTKQKHTTCIRKHTILLSGVKVTCVMVAYQLTNNYCTISPQQTTLALCLQTYTFCKTHGAKLACVDTKCLLHTQVLIKKVPRITSLEGS